MPTLRAITIASFVFVTGLGSSSRAAAQSLVPAGQTIGGISCDAQEGSEFTFTSIW